MKIKIYNTLNKFLYFDIEYKKKHWISISFLGKEFVIYLGKNSQNI